VVGDDEELADIFGHLTRVITRKTELTQLIFVVVVYVPACGITSV
jgi:hypothetical protein